MKKIISFFIVFFVLLTLFLVPSCNNNSKEAGSGSTTENSTQPTSELTANDGIVNRSLYEEPEIKDFEKYDFRILESPDSNVFSFHKQIPEQEIGEAVNDSFIKRNRDIENKYNISISSVYNAAPDTVLKTSIAADEDVCDLAFINSSTIFGLAQVGGLVDFNSVKSLSLDMPWWDQRIIQGLSVYNKIYTLAGDITTNDDVSTLTILYNKKLYSELAYENPYELAANGKWTMDKMMEMTKGVNRDLNGDGVIDEADQWGMASESLALYYFFFGSGMHYIDIISDKYEYTLDDIKVNNVIEKTFNLLTAPDSIFDLSGKIKDTSVSVYVTLERMFLEDRLLFNVRLVGDALNLRGMDSDFGFLPFPKYDEIQKEYYSWVTMNMNSPVMPVTVRDTEKSGLITEALAFESMFAIREPFYGILLNAKVARGDEDTQMLDLILSSKVYDLDGVNYSTGIKSGISDIMTNMLLKREFTLASSWEKIKPKAVANLEDFLKAFS